MAGDVTLLDVTGADGVAPGDTNVSNPVLATMLVNGESDPANPLIIDAPGIGKTGSLDVTIDLSAQDWLQYDWDDIDGLGDGPYDDNPTGRVTWGIFSGADQLIYIREPW